MSSGVLDLRELDARVKSLIESEDMEGIALIDEEIRAYLSFDKEGGAAALKPEQLQQLSGIYGQLTAHVSHVRDGLAVELRGMKAKQKGIKAYQSSNQHSK